MWTRCLLVLAVAQAHPSALECQDPRFEIGSMMMGQTVTDNLEDPAMVFSSDVSEFKSGSKVHISVKANGTKYASGVFLALRIRPILGWKGDYGIFDNFRGGVAMPTKKWNNQDCLNTAVSTEAFTGDAGVTWTASPETVGDCELTLLWSDFSYVYRRTLMLRGPPIPKHPPSWTTLGPAAQGPASPSNLRSPGRGAAGPVTSSDPQAKGGSAVDKCVAPAGGMYNLPHSPVFVQRLETTPVRSVTLPAGLCISCREDHRGRCRSARVECPQEPGALAMESLYVTADCSGEAVVTKVATGHAHCPGPEYHSPELLDLERFVRKLQRDHPAYFRNESTARAAIEEYRRVLYVVQKFPEAPMVPSKLVDLVWHEHVLDTQRYKMDSQRMFGRYIHHAPSFGDEADEAVKAEKQAMLESQGEMFEKYVQLFEDEPRLDMWPTAKPGRGARLPDCCKALCVKPDCSACVGCNAVNCGMMAESPDLLRRSQAGRQAVHVHPDDFAGYVPASPRVAQRLLAAEQSYLCQAKPVPGMELSWTISGDHIYMKQSLEEIQTWYGVGLSVVDPFDMGYADFIVTMFNHNYTGVRDMYKYDEGNNYPCWDVLSQCSLNKTAGRQDLLDRTNVRAGGVSTSTWTRKLDTGDYKDAPITNASQKVLFAHGKDDFFDFHAKQASCDVNFFNGSVACGDTKITRTLPFASSSSSSPSSSGISLV